MLAAGIETAAQLGKQVRPRVPRQTVQGWLGMKDADLSAMSLLALSNALNVRMRWLVTGVGVLHPRQDMDVERAAALLNRFTPAQCDKWFKYGEKLLAGK